MVAGDNPPVETGESLASIIRIPIVNPPGDPGEETPRETFRDGGWCRGRVWKGRIEGSGRSLSAGRPSGMESGIIRTKKRGWAKVPAAAAAAAK